MGRPTKYRKEITEKLPHMFEDGKSVAEVCKEIGISKQTFYRWEKEKQEFSDAIKKGLTASEAWWAKMGRLGMLGKMEMPVNSALWIFNMKNRFHWSDRNDVSVSGGVQVVYADKRAEKL